MPTESFSRFTALAATSALFCLAAAVPAAAEAPISDEERARLVAYLEESRDLFLSELDGLSPEQLSFRPDDESWSLAQIAEHLVLAEGRIFGLVQERVLTATPRPEWRTADGPIVSDTMIRLAASNRTTLQFQAPAAIQPEGLYPTTTTAAEAFTAARAVTLDFARATDRDLRSLFALNPVLGMLDGCQWLVFLGAHVERHTQQAQEVKSDPGFPAS